MKTVYKYDLEVTDKQTISLPKWADILCVQVQDGKPRIWAKVDTKETRFEDRTFYIHGTGHPINEADNALMVHWATFQLLNGALVFHVFEEVIINEE